MNMCFSWDELVGIRPKDSVALIQQYVMSLIQPFGAQGAVDFQDTLDSNLHPIDATLWLCQNSYWKWPFIVDLPIENDDFP